MPAIPFDTLQNILPPEKQQNVYDSVFGPDSAKQTAAEQAAELRNQSFQDWINSRKQAVEQQRTDDIRMARFNALGNVLTTMVQPLGWAVGGGGFGGTTGGVQPYDNRQYLDAFNRAVKANEELRNIGTIEGEYQFKLANEAARRAQAMEDYENKSKIELEKQQQIFDMRSQLSRQQMEERIKVAEATAKAKFQFKTADGGRATESVRDNFLKRANAKYLDIVADYEKKKNLNIEGLQPPKPYDQFIKEYGPTKGIIVDEGSSSTQPAQKGQTATTASGKKANPMGGATSSSASGKKKNPMS